MDRRSRSDRQGERSPGYLDDQWRRANRHNGRRFSRCEPDDQHDVPDEGGEQRKRDARTYSVPALVLDIERSVHAIPQR